MLSPAEPILRVDKINKTYPGVKALCDVDFELHAGEVRALLGKNGAGKSTLVKILSGATVPDSGTVFINGQPTALTSPSAAFAAGVATVYQEMSLIRGLTVAENILLGRWPRRSRLGVQVIDQKATLEQARAALDQMGVAVDLRQIVGRLSVPEQQMVEIAKALAVPTRLVQQLMQTLGAARLVTEATGAEPAYLPARPLENITCHDILLALRASQGQELETRDEPTRSEVYGEFHRIEEAERLAATSVTMLALVNRSQEQKTLVGDGGMG